MISIATRHLCLILKSVPDGLGAETNRLINEETWKSGAPEISESTRRELALERVTQIELRADTIKVTDEGFAAPLL